MAVFIGCVCVCVCVCVCCVHTCMCGCGCMHTPFHACTCTQSHTHAHMCICVFSLDKRALIGNILPFNGIRLACTFDESQPNKKKFWPVFSSYRQVTRAVPAQATSTGRPWNAAVRGAAPSAGTRLPPAAWTRSIGLSAARGTSPPAGGRWSASLAAAVWPTTGAMGPPLGSPLLASLWTTL